MTPVLTQDLIDAWNYYVDSFVDKTTDPRGCWVWAGSKRPTFSWKGKSYPATHVMWLVHTGTPVPDGLFMLHSCDNPFCSSPTHVRPGTAAQNTRDMIERKRNHPEAQAVSRKAVQALDAIGYSPVARAARDESVNTADLNRAIVVGLVPAATVLGRRFVRRIDVTTWLKTIGGTIALERARKEQEIRRNRCQACGAPLGSWPEGCEQCRRIVEAQRLRLLEG